METTTGISGAMTAILEIVTQLFAFIMDNPLLLLFLGASLIPVGMKVFSSMKDAVAN